MPVIVIRFSGWDAVLNRQPGAAVGIRARNCVGPGRTLFSASRNVAGDTPP